LAYIAHSLKPLVIHAAMFIRSSEVLSRYFKMKITAKPRNLRVTGRLHLHIKGRN